MNIDNNFFNESLSKFDFLNILNEKISEITDKLILIDDKLYFLQQKYKQLEDKLINLQITVANLNKNNFIESYNNLRKGISFPHSNVLSRDITYHNPIKQSNESSAID
jgi:hypothetical protein